MTDLLYNNNFDIIDVLISRDERGEIHEKTP